MASFYLIWQDGLTVLTGLASDNVTWLNNPEVFAVNYPGNMTEAKTITVMSSAQANKTYNTLTNVRIYLTGDPTSLTIIQQLWPSLGSGYNPPRPNLDGGFEISFDGGRNYTRFDSATGNQAVPSSWITLPAGAVGITGQNGVLGPFDVATFIVRFVIPTGAVEYQKLNIGLALDFDVI